MLRGNFARMTNFGHYGRILDQRDERVGELVNILRIAAGDDIAVGDRGLIDHMGACVPEVGPDRRPAGRGRAAHQVRFHQQPRPMADCTDRLALSGKALDQPDDVGVCPQMVGIAHAAGQYQRVEIVSIGIVDGEIGPDRLARIVADRRLDGRDWLAGFRSFADPYFYMTLRWAQGTGVDMSGLDKVTAFKARMEQDAGVQAALRAEGLA